MIDGLRIAPHVYAIRRTARIEGTAQDRHLDCSQCLEWMDESARAAARCGWLPAHRLPELDPEPDPAKRTANPLLPQHAPSPVSQECPGWLIALPEVQEAVHARMWWEKGQLGEYLRLQRGQVSPHFELYLNAAAGAFAEADEIPQREAYRRSRQQE